MLCIRYKLFEKLMKVVNRDLHRDTSYQIDYSSSIVDSDLYGQLRIIIHIILYQLFKLN